MSQKQDQCGVEMMQKIKVLSAKSLEQSKVLSFKLGAGQILALSALPVVGNTQKCFKGILMGQLIHLSWLEGCLMKLTSFRV